jgi:hypothetical protein
MAMVVVVVAGHQPGRPRANRRQASRCAMSRESSEGGDKGGGGRQLGMEEGVKGVEEEKEEKERPKLVQRTEGYVVMNIVRRVSGSKGRAG